MLDSWIEWLEVDEACPACDGKRLNPTALAVRFRGPLDRRPHARCRSPTVERFFDELTLAGPRSARSRATSSPSCKSRLGFLQRGRASATWRSTARAPTLSGGEAQRIRLAAQLGSNLRGVCYILDEPTIGLHPRDNRILLDTLAKLEAKGNTLVVVEHDEDTIRRAEHVIDLGPGAGTLRRRRSSRRARPTS